MPGTDSGSCFLAEDDFFPVVALLGVVGELLNSCNGLKGWDWL